MDPTTFPPLNPSIDASVAAVSRLPAIAVILDVVTRITGMRFAAVARVTDDRWLTCASRDDIAFGLKPGDELPIETTICNEIRQHRRMVVIPDVGADADFSCHATPSLYGFRSYISVPILRKAGDFFGTLCAIDPLPAPRLQDPTVVHSLGLFAELIGAQLDLEDRVDESSVALVDANARLELRDQFVAVLGHDLRSPLRTISVGSEMLRRRWPGDSAPPALIGTIQQACRRMAALVDDTLDFARGALGGGIPVTPVPTADLAGYIEDVVDEIRLGNPEATINTSLYIPEVVVCDVQRLGQLLSNLIGNAITHGDASQPVTVTADARAGFLAISVANVGRPIPTHVIKRLFQPFVKVSNKSRAPEGLGLGLYIAHEIARGHRGTLSHRMDDGHVTFTLLMPLRGPATSSAPDQRMLASQPDALPAFPDRPTFPA